MHESNTVSTRKREKEKERETGRNRKRDREREIIQQLDCPSVAHLDLVGTSSY